MAIFKGGNKANSEVVVEEGAARTMIVPRGSGYAASATTGTIAAALAVNSAVFSMRLDPGSTVRAFIERIRLQWTCIAAFTTPVTVGRRLELYRGSGAAHTGGSAITAAHKKSPTSGGSEFDTALGGDMRVASTSALGASGITFEAPAIRSLSLVHVGNAGNFIERLWEFHATEAAPIQLEPGQLIAIRNPVVMDAAGTWTLGVDVDWHEASAI